jgi:hypothetical protein
MPPLKPSNSFHPWWQSLDAIGGRKARPPVMAGDVFVVGGPGRTIADKKFVISD